MKGTVNFFRDIPDNPHEAFLGLGKEGERHFRRCRRTLGFSIFLLFWGIVLMAGCAILCLPLLGAEPMFPLEDKTVALVMLGGAGLNLIALICAADAKWRHVIACQMLSLRGFLYY